LNSINEIIHAIHVKTIKVRGINSSDILIFTKQMDLLLNSEMPIIDAFLIILKQTNNIVLKEMYTDMLSMISKGHSLSSSLNKYIKYFGYFYINIIKAGEISGSINQSFTRLYFFLNQKQNIKKNVIDALSYPLFILFFSILLLYLILFYFIPQMSQIFIENNITKTYFLSCLLFLSNFIKKYNIIFMIFFILCILALYKFSNTNIGKIYLNQLLIKIPIINTLIYMFVALEFLIILETLLKGGIVLSVSLDISVESIHNHVIKAQIKKMSNKIKNGNSIAIEMANLSLPLFPFIISQIIAIGEKTGKLEKSLQIASNYIKEDIYIKINFFMKLLGPILIVFMGCIIGIIMLTTIMPLFEMYTCII